MTTDGRSSGGMPNDREALCAEAGNTGGRKPIQGLSVLVLEDDDLVCRSTVRQLLSAGCSRVAEAATVSDGLTLSIKTRTHE